MTWFADLDYIDYHDGPYDWRSWSCPLLAVGWLDRDHPHETGPSDPSLVSRVAELRRWFREVFSGFRGLHACDACGDTLPESHVNLFVPGDGVMYLAPGRIDHYVSEHGYRPPNAFVNALLSCPDPRTPAYAARVTELEGGRPPLFPQRWRVFRVEAGGRVLFADNAFEESAQVYARSAGWVVEPIPDAWS